MSPEIIEAIYSYSDYPLGIICSKNQIDVNHGYVFTTSQFIDYIKPFRHDNVWICRDHCGDGFGIDSPEDTIKEDIRLGFDLIHIDTCFSKDKLKRMEELIGLCSVGLELGTDENSGVLNFDYAELDALCQFYKQFNPKFVVVQTGSLLYNNQQWGKFNIAHVNKVKKILDKYGLQLKEHNCDYLNDSEIRLRNHAINIAPQLGSIQTATILNKAQIYGIKTDKYKTLLYNSPQLKKWCDSAHKDILSVGHYFYKSDEYKSIYDKLSKYVDIKTLIEKEIHLLIDHYRFNL